MNDHGERNAGSNLTRLVLRREEWERPDESWRGRVEGLQFGSTVSVIFYATDTLGAGPPLHVHDYDEIFIVREGRARFAVGDTELDAGTGDIVFGPAGVPHRFWNRGPGRLETTDIHLAPVIRQRNLE